MFPLFRSTVLIPACFLLVWASRDVLISKLFPYGLPHRLHHRPTVGKIDPHNDSLRFKHGKLKKIYERRDGNDTSPPLLSSPETVFFGPDGTMYTTTDRSQLISLTDWKHESGEIISAKATLIKELGPGRPLGAKFTQDGTTIYIADAVLGLLRVRTPLDETTKVEIVASTVVEDGQRTKLLFADDVAIGPVTGKVYFTDATNVPPPRSRDMTYDAMYASKVDALIAGASGRLLEYDPSTDTMNVLAKNLWFANGVGVAQDEEYLVFAETFRLSLVKYYLKGEMKGKMEYIVKGDPTPACELARSAK